MDQELTITFITETQVSMSNTEGEDIAEKLINGGHAKTKSVSEKENLSLEGQTMPSEEVSVFISSVNEKGFYLQLANEETTLQNLADLLQTLCPTLQPVHSILQTSSWRYPVCRSSRGRSHLRR